MSLATLGKAELAGKKALVRVDFNVPFEKGTISSDARIKATLESINYLVEHEATVILMAHLGRPKGRVDDNLRLAPVAKRLEILLGKTVFQCSDSVGKTVEDEIEANPDTKIFLLENIRFYKEETDNDPNFAKQLADLGDIFIQESFGTAHRAHASTVGVANYLPAYAGFLVQKEIDVLSQALTTPLRPYVAIVGGSKVSTKIGVLDELIKHVDTLIIGGAMAFTFLKALGKDVGKSLFEADKVAVASALIEKAKQLNKRLILPIDVVVAGEFSADASTETVSIDAIPHDKMGLDIGEQSSAMIADCIQGAKMLIWNGPVGAFELEPFSKGTFAIARQLADSDAFSIIGGGDSISAIEKCGLTEKMNHISTGGGACLEYLEGKVLPGIQVIQNKELA